MNLHMRISINTYKVTLKDKKYKYVNDKNIGV